MVITETEVCLQEQLVEDYLAMEHEKVEESWEVLALVGMVASKYLLTIFI